MTVVGIVSERARYGVGAQPQDARRVDARVCAENVDRVLPILDEMVTEGMVTLERVEVIACRARG